MDNVPTSEEFNRKMSECVEYKKLTELKKQLDWFDPDVCGISIIPLYNKILQRLKEIPKESRDFDHEVHGEVTNKWK
tara:strand:- start:256 stop:486 length:231 start_codon:yes stop_codon:yes gene_type:complete